MLFATRPRVSRALISRFGVRRYINQALTSWQTWLSLGYYMSVVVPLYSVGLFMPTLIQVGSLASCWP